MTIIARLKMHTAKLSWQQSSHKVLFYQKEDSPIFSMFSIKLHAVISKPKHLIEMITNFKNKMFVNAFTPPCMSQKWIVTFLSDRFWVSKENHPVKQNLKPSVVYETEPTEGWAKHSRMYKAEKCNMHINTCTAALCLFCGAKQGRNWDGERDRH